ncbi:MAG TPA: DUF3054 domain-containing protein [Ilumatobacteraceae bacterium]|nr:DUF3054 domain-containing protein [Ilumatobacteraceae bacterium]HRB03191.1 DUF3054 domain-containing protein [Ilumatobacteraceae bacterium]
MSEALTSRRSVQMAAALDVVALVVFVIIGRRSHDEGSALSGIVKVAAPFLIALILGWLVARAWKNPMAVGTGVIVWLVTVIGGLVLRKVAFDGGTAVPFIIVASLFTLCTLVGWRFLAEWRKSRSAA